jgi:ribonuclease J
VYAHTSEHATIEDLQTFAEALKPRMLVPVHTEYKESCIAQFSDVQLIDNRATFRF